MVFAASDAVPLYIWSSPTDGGTRFSKYAITLLPGSETAADTVSYAALTGCSIASSEPTSMLMRPPLANALPAPLAGSLIQVRNSSPASVLPLLAGTAKTLVKPPRIWLDGFSGSTCGNGMAAGSKSPGGVSVSVELNHEPVFMKAEPPDR